MNWLLYNKLIRNGLSSSRKDYSLILILSLSTLKFVAGFIEALVAGGGLIQISVHLIELPDKAGDLLF
ncbi:hypothetical protein SAMN04487995_6153 [Dyadobacter koreensis]|uniref:Uncharacterized protein n=1 Tax=Dyadobacter koreensis TaxID=408657 RepID=A0A1H7BF94_9BACT|nr:hypothetical protein [Dyadobacter koreensis]SEJ72890.1 hypothetical protein SAMN04487995_6153 [Dyadobacter koreensis]